MNMYANGNGKGRTVMEFEAAPHSELASGYFRADSKIAYDSRADRKGKSEFDRQRTIQAVSQIASRVVPLARYLAPLAARAAVDAVPAARASFNPLTVQLLYPLLQKGERYVRQKEVEFFGAQPTVVRLANTGIASEAALTEVLAAEASHTESESEAAAFIGTSIPIALKIMEGHQLLRPVLPALLAATARLARFLHRYSPDSRRLLRLVPTILRQTIATLIAARGWGCPLTSALVGCVLAIQTRRVLGNAKLVGRSITRNALIRISTVAAAPSFTDRRSRSIQNQRPF